jgi:hypothetical protein
MAEDATTVEMTTLTPATTPPASIIPAQLARLAWLCTVASGLILAGVLGGNALLLLAGFAPTLWLIALVDIGPLIALALGNVATITGYYGTWRILRRLDEYSAREDAKNQLLQAPGLVQDLPRALSRRFGCVHIVALGTLAVSLVVTGLTLAPPPLRALGVAVVVAAPTPTPTLSPTPSPTATPASVLNLAVRPTSAREQCAADGTLPPLNVTLDNTGSTVAVGWSVGITDTLPGTNVPWATTNPAAGSVAAGATGEFALVSTDRLCDAFKQPQAFTATVTLSNGAVAPISITDTITPVGTAGGFAVTRNQDIQQTCVPGTVPLAPAYTLTLSNQSSGASVTWSIGQFDLNVNGSPWATANPARGLVEGGTTSSITITPSAVACQIGTPTTWHAQITTSQGTTITVTDVVTP